MKLDKLAEEKLTSTQIKIIDKVESVGLDFDGDGWRRDSRQTETS